MNIEQFNHFADFPQSEGNNTSSIGGGWPPEKSSFDRTKAVFDQFINSEQQYSQLLNVFNDYCHVLSENNSRIQFRAVLNNDFLTQAIYFRAPIEAIMELDQDTFGEPSYLVYLSALYQCRKPAENDLDKLNQHVDTAIIQPRQSQEQLLAKASENGYQISVITGSEEHAHNNHLVDQITELYSRFGWDKKSVISLLSNQDQLIGIASKNNQIVTAGLIEMASLEISGKKFRIAEITEAATHSEHTNGGLYKAVSTSLLIELQRLSRQRNVMGGEVDLVFGECNGLSQGVLIVAAQQGRLFATKPYQETGELLIPGVLCQQVPINDPDGPHRSTRFNDLVPTYLTRRRLYEL